MRKLTLEADNLGKYYGLYGSPLQRMSQLLWKREQQRGFWALRHVNFSVAAGESFAIIGRNGGGWVLNSHAANYAASRDTETFSSEFVPQEQMKAM